MRFGDAPEAPRTESQLDRAIDLLRALLATEPVPAKSVEEEAKGAGISWPTIKRAKDALGVVTRRDGKANMWYWALPAKEEPTLN